MRYLRQRVLWALALGMCLGVASVADPAPPSTKDLIFAKLQSDRSYFQHIASLKAQGRTDPKMSRADWQRDVQRAPANLAVLDRAFKERDDYLRGKPLTQPSRDEAFRVYTNLFTLLNMIQAYEAGKWSGVVDSGQKVVVRDRKDFGVLQTEDARYYLGLFREYFYLMAAAEYRLGRDADAVSWFARIEANADIQALKKKIADEPQKQVDDKAQKLAILQGRPIAMMPFANLEKNAATDWVGSGLSEVLSTDLIQHTELTLVERTNIAKVMKEIALSQSGITDARAAQSVGQLLSAGALIVGTYLAQGETGLFTLKLVDAQSGQALLSSQGRLRQTQLFADAREVLLGLLGQAGWISDDTKSDIEAAHAPKPDTIRELLQARLLMASKSDQAKALYAKAIKEDPAYAKAFQDLKKEFSGISSAIAVMPFVNASGAKDDLWMVTGVGEALMTDLPKIGFTVVEREKLGALLEQREIGQVIDPGHSRDVGHQVGADFVVLGSVLHQKPEVRADLRFVDVRTGIVLNSVSAEGKSSDFPQLLVALSTEIAKRFNEKLSEKTLAELSGKKMSREEFERFARQQLAKESLARSLRPPKAEPAPNRTPFWIAVGASVVGTGVAVTGLALGERYRDAASYSGALIQYATQIADQQRLNSYTNLQDGRAQAATIVAYSGAAVAVAGVGFLVWHELFPPPKPTSSDATALRMSPFAVPSSGGGLAGISAHF